MVNEKIKEIETYKQRIATLEQELETERLAKLANLHNELGYDSVDSLISALNRVRGRGRRGKRTVITAELREGIKQALLSGKTGSATAREFGVSIPTIQNIKKDLRLVKKRKTAKK